MFCKKIQHLKFFFNIEKFLQKKQGKNPIML